MKATQQRLLVVFLLAWVFYFGSQKFRIRSIDTIVTPIPVVLESKNYFEEPPVKRKAEVTPKGVLASMIPDQKKLNCAEKVLKERKSVCGKFCIERSMPEESDVRRFYEDNFSSGVFEPKQEQRTAIGKTYLALHMAGMLSTVTEPEQKLTNYSRALKLLAEVSFADPTNSMPYLFMALIEKRRSNPTAAIEYLQTARSNSMRFDSYLQAFNTELFRHASQDPAAYLEAIFNWSDFPMPDYVDLATALKTLDYPLGYFGYQMIAKGLEMQGAYTSVKWDTIEYAVGRTFVRFDEPDQREPEHIPTYKELLKKSATDFKAQNLIIFQDILDETCEMPDFQGRLKNFASNL